MTAGAADDDVLRGFLAAAAGGICFSFDLPLLRLAGLDPWTMILGRGILMFLALTGWWLVQHRKERGSHRFIAGLPGALVLGINTIAPLVFIAAVTHTTASHVVFILALAPLLTAVLSWLFLRESVHPYTWAAAPMALVGVGIIVGDGMAAGNWFGDVMALGSALFTALVFVVSRGSGAQIVTSLATGSLLAAVIALIAGANPANLLAPAAYGVPAVVWLGINGLVVMPMAFTLLAMSPRYLPSTDVSMFLLLETILAPVWIWLLNGEQTSSRSLAGGLVIIFTLTAHSLWRLRATLRGA